MKIKFILFISSVKEKNRQVTMMKAFDSTVRPVEGDIIEDPGFHPEYHNGYEVVKVTMNYSSDECWVSLSPLAIEKEDIEIAIYIDHLQANGWQVISKEELHNT
ncbi:hypothetical protein [Halobacillus litoralis]|uniref:Uncharacterized protein n=1 Tax=Halobacillus litoralis TaxID=45668 RepID=A0A410MBK6_9BACI|nr:hypothetical protein [Halobacillus litoralis]QAS52063.1 hypothetical protein HLI_07415 [Halobacillus litoralis]